VTVYRVKRRKELNSIAIMFMAIPPHKHEHIEPGISYRFIKWLYKTL